MIKDNKFIISLIILSIPFFLITDVAIAKNNVKKIKNQTQEVNTTFEELDESKSSKDKDPNKFPMGCREVGFEFKNYILHLNPNAAGGSQSLYFLHNSHSKLVRLYQMQTGDEPYVMHLNNDIYENQWAVFATDEDQVKFICTVPRKDSDYGDIADCSKLLRICEYDNVKFSINNYGNYWSVASDIKTAAVRSVISQGILLKW